MLISNHTNSKWWEKNLNRFSKEGRQNSLWLFQVHKNAGYLEAFNQLTNTQN